MFGEEHSIMCIFVGSNHTFQKQTQVYDKLNKLNIEILYGLLTVFVLTSNLMLIYGFYKTSPPFTIITKLFIYLSLVDTIMNLVTTFYITLTFLDYSMTCLAVFFMLAFMQLIYILGLVIFATISFLRYWSIKKPLHSIGTSRIVIVLIVQAVVCIIIGSSFMAFFYLGVSPDQMMKVNYAIPILQLLAISFVLSVNIMSYRKLKAMKRMSGFSADNIENTSTQRQKTLSEANICLLYITAFYILCPAPMLIFFCLTLNNYCSPVGDSIFSQVYMYFIYQMEVSIH